MKLLIKIIRGLLKKEEEIQSVPERRIASVTWSQKQKEEAYFLGGKDYFK